MTLFRRGVTLFRLRVTVHVTLCHYAERYRKAGERLRMKDDTHGK
jgi:hypothetical protein